jgi:aspartate/methionine/tyrosine aminotransferase
MKTQKQQNIDRVIKLEKPATKLRYIKHPNNHWYQENLDKRCHDRILRLTRGIYVMEEWRQLQKINVSYPLTNYTVYALNGIKQLEKYIRYFHKELAPHINLEKKEFVFGIGATQIIHAAMYALCIQHGRRISHDHKSLSITPLYFTHQIPGYLGVKEWIDLTNSFNAKWVTCKDAKNISSDDLVEFVSCPNNPTGKILTPITNTKNIVYDRVNYWPFYMTNSLEIYQKDTLSNDAITIFSLPKILSFSGSRVGYAFVEDKKIAHYMKYFIINNTHGVAVDGQLRCLTAMRYLIENNKIHEYTNWLTNAMQKRWHMLKKTIALTDIKLLNSQGASAWIKTPTEADQYLLNKYRLISTFGPEYGASKKYARLNMTCTTNEFYELLYRLKHN